MKWMKRNHNPWYQKLIILFRRDLRWLSPGLGVKRWIALILAGTTLIAIGFAFFAADVYRTTPLHLVAA